MYEFNEQTRATVALVKRLVDEHQMPLERRILRGEDVPASADEAGRNAAREAGLWSLTSPPEFGGPGLSVVDILAITEENLRCVRPLRFGGNVLPNLYGLEGEQKARYLDPLLAGTITSCFAQSEPGGGGDPAGAIQTRAERTDTGWVLNGTKVWISNFDMSDICFVLARTDRESRTGGISMFAVETSNPGIIRRPIRMIGGVMTISELIFDDCHVDELALIGMEGGGFKAGQVTLTAARMTVAAGALGVAGRALEMMIDYAKQRKVFGQTLADYQDTQSKIVDSWVELQQNRLLVYASGEKADRGEDTRIEASMIKMTCTEMVGRVLDRAIQIFGAAGCAMDNPLAHWVSLHRMTRIVEGPTEVHKYRVLARHLLR